MLFPFQQYYFYSSSPVKEIRRKFLLLLDQKYTQSSKRRLIRTGETSQTPMFTGTFEEEKIILNTHKYNGDEDIVKISGQLKAKGQYQCMEIQLLITTSYLVTFAASIIIALVAAYMYTYIGEKIFHRIFSNEMMPYLILVISAIYINLRRYSNKATALLEHLVYWLELEEEE